MKYTNTTKAVIRVWLHCIRRPFTPTKNIIDGCKYIAKAIEKDADEEMERREHPIHVIDK